MFFTFCIACMDLLAGYCDLEWEFNVNGNIFIIRQSKKYHPLTSYDLLLSIHKKVVLRLCENISIETARPDEAMVSWEEPAGSLMMRWLQGCDTLQPAHTDSKNNPLNRVFKSVLSFNHFFLQAVVTDRGHLGGETQRNCCTLELGAFYSQFLFCLCPLG